MSDILQEILLTKSREVALSKLRVPEMQLEKEPFFDRPRLSMMESLLRSSTGIIAEIKRKSPSQGLIKKDVSMSTLANGYEAAGVSGLSVLTDTEYFGGTLDDLKTARVSCSLPILRKDFIVDEYQIVEARSAGADVILLIAAALETAKLKGLTAMARTMRLEVLVEIHNRAELDRCLDLGADMVGVNNRNLSTFAVDLGVSRALYPELPSEAVKVAESGIGKPETVHELRNLGYRGFLIGGNFMKHADPPAAASAFSNELRKETC